MKSDFHVQNIQTDTEGRAIYFEIEELSFLNVYPKSGTDGDSKQIRESFIHETLPQLLLNRKDSGCIGGDWNCITHVKDCTKHPDVKMSTGLKSLISTFSLKDSYRTLYPTTKAYSRFYSRGGEEGATRLDRSYYWGQVSPVQAEYVSIAFSDHLAFIETISIPDNMSKVISPRSRPFFKTSPVVVKDPVFQARLKAAMLEWLEVKDKLPVTRWWELIVKSGVRKLALNRTKEINKQRRSYLNLQMLRQVFLTKKVQGGEVGHLEELREVQRLIKVWYEEESRKVVIQARVEDVQQSEKIRIYHHSIHKKRQKRSAILKLQTEEGLIEGHLACSSYLQDKVEALLLHPATLNPEAQAVLLSEVSPVFTEADNVILKKSPSKAELKEVLASSNLHAAPGTDGLTSYLYNECWDVLGDPLHEVISAIWAGEKLTPSQKTSIMVFGAKPKKPTSILPSDKRRISILNSDFKLLTAAEAFKYKPMLTHALSPLQVVAGDNRRIHHAINKARDAINAVSKSKVGCALLDLDFEMAFCLQAFSWVVLVLRAKGACEEAINRLLHIYEDRITLPVVNNVIGSAVKNIRGSLSQGCPSSMNWFALGIDPLLVYLEKRLSGILISSIPTCGPSLRNGALPAPVEERYTVYGLADDVKPAVCKISEFSIVDTAARLFEQSSGCRLHRDPEKGKCQALPLGKWRNTLKQEDTGLPYLRLSSSIRMVGVELTASWQQSRATNCDRLLKSVRELVGGWKAGKFMPLVCRPFSVNVYLLSKIWFISGSVNLRSGDIKTISTLCRGWVTQDLLQKPSEVMLYRPTEKGGLGLHHLYSKSMATLITTFLQTAASTRFLPSLYHTWLYRYHVLEEEGLPDPGYTPYYNHEFFSIIRKVHKESTLNPALMTIKMWYNYLLEETVTTRPVDDEGRREQVPCRVEERLPTAPWPEAYRLLRLKGISVQHKSFLYKLVHELLPSKERVSRILQNASPLCSLCQQGVTETYLHIFFHCPANEASGQAMLSYAKFYNPSLTDIQSLRLEITPDLAFALPTTTILATGLCLIWENRVQNRRTGQVEMKAALKSKAGLLRKVSSRKVREAGSVILNILEM